MGHQELASNNLANNPVLTHKHVCCPAVNPEEAANSFVKTTKETKGRPPTPTECYKAAELNRGPSPAAAAAVAAAGDSSDAWVNTFFETCKAQYTPVSGVTSSKTSTGRVYSECMY